MEPPAADEAPWEDEDVVPEKNANLIMGVSTPSIPLAASDT